MMDLRLTTKIIKTPCRPKKFVVPHPLPPLSKNFNRKFMKQLQQLLQRSWKKSINSLYKKRIMRMRSNLKIKLFKMITQNRVKSTKVALQQTKYKIQMSKIRTRKTRRKQSDSQILTSLSMKSKDKLQTMKLSLKMRKLNLI